jgi:hypothetical protein
MAFPHNVLFKSLGLKAVEVVAGIIVWLALVSYPLDPPKLSAAILAAVAGLLLAVHMEGLLLRDELQDIRRSYGWMARLAESADPIDRLLLGLALKYPGGKIPGPEITAAWLDLSWIFKTNYDATNYIKPDEIYTEFWATPALKVQIAKALSGRNVHIRKVFLVDEEIELKQVRELLNEQVEARINIHYSRYSKIASSSLLDSLAKPLASTDFGIFDGRCVLVWNLKNRKAVDGELIFDSGEIEKYQKFFDKLFAASTPWTAGSARGME